MPDRLAEIRARLDAATPGPTPRVALRERQHGMDALYAHAPADIAWLLDEVERYRRLARVAREKVEDEE